MQNSSPLLALIGIALGVTTLTWGVHCLGILQILEWAILDQWFRSRPVEQYTPPVVIVSIDDHDIAVNGSWPLTDEKLAQLLTQIKSHQPAAIGLDLYRDLPIEPGHDQLEQVFRTTPNLIGIEKVVGEGASTAIAPSPTLAALDQVAFNDLVLDGDGNVRRHLLSLRHNEQTKFALGTTLALLYLKQQAGVVPESLDGERIRLGLTEFIPLHSNAGAYYQVDAGGYQILANYLRPAQGMPTVSMQAVFDNNIPAGLLEQKVVLIGLKADSNWGDRFYTSYSLNSAQSWSGVEIHANLTAQLIASALEGRPPLYPLPESIEWGWVLLWASLGVASNRALSLNWRYWLHLPGLVTILVGTTYLIFLGNYWLPLIPALVGVSGSWVVAQGYLVWHRLRQEKQILEQTVQARTQELRQQNQALEQARVQADLANQAKSKFLAHISHELRTPLTAILGFGDLLENSPNLLADEKDYVETINRCGEHLLALINNVLELSKIETGSTTVTIESVNLPKLLSDVQQMFQAQVTAKNLKLQIKLADTVPHWIEIDGGKLRQIIINLVGNAIKFTENGHITLQCQIDADTQDFLEFVVEDTGPGMASDEIELLFKPFVQTTSGKKIGKGTGLGLALSRQCVELMGGTIGVSSVYGQGSRFFFKIPLRPTALSTLNPNLSSPEEHCPIPNISTDYRILIVDDEMDNQRLLAQWLTDAQFKIKTAASGTTALQVFKQWQPHLILLDVHLPDFDGYEVARRMRGQWTEYSPQGSFSNWLDEEEPVILAITAGILQDNYADLLAAGCDDVLWKPIKAETLFTKISEYVMLNAK